MKFEWDEEKNLENIRKHGIDFADVPATFNWHVLVELDNRHDYGEDRWIGLGMLREMTVVVIFVERTPQTIRIISARKANQYERKRYQSSIPH